MLTVRGLSNRFLVATSFDLADGECIAVRGSSGAGKTVLLRAIADLDPAGGEVCLDGVPSAAMPAPEWRRKVHYLAAEPAWWGEGVVEHFPDWRKALPLIERLLLPVSIGTATLARLSTGERQRLALVRSLVRPPRVLLADEPTAALDPAATAAAEALIAELRRNGMAVLWVSHDPAQVKRVAERVLTVEGGHVAEAHR